MKPIKFLAVILFTTLITSCERVAPNYQGVLMENYGKSGKSDYSLVMGRVNTTAPGTELFQVPLFEKRGETQDQLHLKAADNTEFTAKPVYSIKAISNMCVDIVFENSNLKANEDFLLAIEDNILEPKIYDLMKEASRSYTTDTLMASGGSLKFEQHVQEDVKLEFAKKGFELLSFSCQLDFTDKVKQGIDTRNEVKTSITTLTSQIEEQRLKNDLAKLQADYYRIIYTPEYLQERMIDALKWSNNRVIITDGKTPVMLSN